MFIKLSIEEIPPFTIVALRLSLSLMIFLAILYFLKQGLPKTVEFWAHATVMAILASVIPYTLFCVAEQSIESALAAILTGGSPMVTALLSHQFIPSDRLTISKIAGISLSFFGILMLFAPTLLEGVSSTTFGMSCAAGAALSYGASHMYGKKFITGLPPFVAPTAQMLAGTIIMGLLSFSFDSPLSLPMPSWTAISGILGLVIFCTIFAFSIYYELLEKSGATAVSMVACIFPIGAMLLGFLFLDETFSSLDLVAAAVILSGTLLVNGVISLEEEGTIETEVEVEKI